jgi:hypothetical protein
MKDFFNGLLPQIQEAIMEDYRDIQEQIGDEEIYVAVLTTDSDCITLALWANTVENMTEDDKWIVDEWDYEAAGTAKICKLLHAQEKALHDEDASDEKFDEFYRLFIETVTTAFASLIQSNAFGLDPEKVIYFIHMTDDERADIIARDSAKALNSPKRYEWFLNDSWLGGLDI